MSTPVWHFQTVLLAMCSWATKTTAKPSKATTGSGSSRTLTRHCTGKGDILYPSTAPYTGAAFFMADTPTIGYYPVLLPLEKKRGDSAPVSWWHEATDLTGAILRVRFYAPTAPNVPILSLSNVGVSPRVSVVVTPAVGSTPARSRVDFVLTPSETELLGMGKIGDVQIEMGGILDTLIGFETRFRERGRRG
jgi:hypothetical protein